ncbi:hypothetical protein MMC30_008391 [Trapelia coarctata]|nr:hypothetical protein [Trapelia coarctata]
MATFSKTAAIVATKAAEVSQLLRELQLPEPTFDEDGVTAFDSKHNADVNNEALRQARNALINATRDLSHLTMGPVDYLTSIAWSAAEVANLGTLVRLNIPKKVPRHGSRRLDELARELDLPDVIVTSTIRYAISNGIFCETVPGVIAHTAASARLASDADIHDYAVMCAAEISELLVNMPETVIQKQALKEKGPASASNVAYPEYVNIFEYFGKNPEAAQRYFTFLAARGRLPRWSPSCLVMAWDWASVGAGPVVDVGGSVGLTSLVLAQAFPSINLVSQDISVEAIKEGEALVISSDLQHRVTFSHHDFFTPQPVAAKAYIFKNILHDWPDADCVRMIKALLPALEDGAHVLVAESIMPDPPATRIGAWDDRAIR